MDDDEAPTHRESGQLAVFEQTAREAIARLSTLVHDPDDSVEELLAEARELLRIFEGWKADPPIGEQRTHVVGRVLDLHRNVESLIAERREP